MSRMQFGQLDNCKVCGNLFLKDHMDYCLDCYKGIEEEYEVVAEFLKDEKNRNSTLKKVSNATGVSMKRIMEFMRDGRIYAADFPELSYPCIHCGQEIQSQYMCQSCANRFTTDLNRALQKENSIDRLYGSDIRQKETKYWQLK